MQHAEFSGQTTTLQDELEDRIGLDFCIHEQHWLDYCRLGGHEHYELPEAGDRREGYAKAA